MRRHRQSGQALIELALVMPMLLWFALGTLDYGRVSYAYVGLTNAAREGARHATLLAPVCDTATIKSATIAAEPDLSIPAAVISVNCANADRRTVTITSYPVQLITPFIDNVLGDASGHALLSTSATLPVLSQ